MTNKQNSNYLPNLDGIRFLGAMAILVFHAEDIKQRTGRESILLLRHFYSGGDLIVSIFFVLSGFLITYLLLKEKQATHSIELKSFYKRRILKIWPLYYLILIIGFFLMPLCDAFFSAPYSSALHTQFWYKLISCAFFIPPLLSATSTVPITIGPIWTVMIEEVFYLFWPLLLKRSKNYLRLFIGFIITMLVIRAGFYIRFLKMGNPANIEQIYFFSFIWRLVVSYRFSCMAIGAIGAYFVVSNKTNILNILYRKDMQWGTAIIACIMLALKVHIPFFYHEFYSTLFCILIVNMATNPKTVFNLNSKWMSYIGKASYGIYLFNPFTRIFCLEFVEHVFGKPISGWQMEAIFFALCILSTIGISLLSYKFFEKPFLKLKSKFTVGTS